MEVAAVVKLDFEAMVTQFAKTKEKKLLEVRTNFLFIVCGFV